MLIHEFEYVLFDTEWETSSLGTFDVYTFWYFKNDVCRLNINLSNSIELSIYRTHSNFQSTSLSYQHGNFWAFSVYYFWASNIYSCGASIMKIFELKAYTLIIFELQAYKLLSFKNQQFELTASKYLSLHHIIFWACII